VKILLERPPNPLIFNKKFSGGLKMTAMWVKPDSIQRAETPLLKMVKTQKNNKGGRN